MNYQTSTSLINKNIRNDYETRFLLQSRNHSPLASPRSPKKTSRALKLLGGTAVLDFVAIYMAERIADDEILSEIYCNGNLNSKSQVQIQKDLLLLALDDNLSELTSGSKKRVYGKPILQKHVRRGLMDDDANFDRMAKILASALSRCQIKDDMAIAKTQRRFAALKPMLEVTKEHLILQGRQMESIRLPFLGNYTKRKEKAALP